MVATPETRVTGAPMLAAVTVVTGNIRLTKFDALVALNYPTASIRATTAPMLVSGTAAMPLRATTVSALVAAANGETLRTTEAMMLVAVRGRVQDPRVRAWTFTLDGHDFYVLRLGYNLTLVYDVLSQEWVDWDAFEQTYWPVTLGFNWIGSNKLLAPNGLSWGSNILVGDDTLGLLWFLDPNQPFDQSFDGPLDPQQAKYFPRVTMGQLPLTGRTVMPCYSAWLTTDMGAPAYLGAGVRLEISDDAGKSYTDMGLVTVTAGDNRPQLAWYSLGQIEAPGRLFRITDDGAVTRIDGMEMNDPDGQK